MAISAGVKIVMSWVLTAQPHLGIMGAAWATNVDFGVAAVLNMYFVQRYVRFDINIKDTVKAIVATLVMGAVVLLTYDAVMTNCLNNTVATLVSIAVGAFTYGIVLLIAGGIETRDVEKVPKVGARLAMVLCRVGLLRK
jgi:stage V sporulation protein B